MNPPDFAGALTNWRAKFAGQEDSLDATWELAAIEERWGDSLFSGGEPGAAVHFQKAQRALVPPGTMFSSCEENDRRMEAYTRLTNKLYEIGGDGRRRGAAPRLPVPSKEERRAAVRQAREKREKRDTELGRLHQQSGHHHHYELGRMWFEAAQALAARHPTDARTACEWSRHFFELYNEAWTEHLPASRWDSDGGAEMSDAEALKNSLDAGRPESAPPDWVRLLIEGQLRRAAVAFDRAAPAPEYQPLAALLADARRTAGL